ncbi:exopolysaccharide biosynthesis polyprenyl glycosylphosphotransferase [Ktedonobacter racemifer DSM 44963]|uniref:Exopolysaccharide biosynthesis polyprenyl glycosylphosphotransferase n=2 Tax=Ktedonobacter racemifer TaxID=363277 RepID=D6TL77_KTERA|nr:exopolysaccharide biosynthesis polyprenyl glycosylphosphotransferase [Ktedonobacter racemifer DSM 44963]
MQKETMKIDTSRTGITRTQNAPQPGLSGTTGATGPITQTISKRRSHRRQWRIFECVAMLVLDAWLIHVSFQLAYTLRQAFDEPGSILSHLLINVRTNLLNNDTAIDGLKGPDHFLGLEIGIILGLLVIFIFRGLYRLRLTGTWFRQAQIILGSTTLGLAFLITYYFTFQPPATSRLLFVFTWLVTILMLILGRFLVSEGMSMLYRMGLGETRLLVVGSGRLGKMVMQHITASPNLGYSIVGFLHDMSEEPGDFGRFKMLGTIDDIAMVIRSMQIDEVIIALPSNLHQQAVRSVKLCERLGTSFKLIPDLYELSLSRIDMEAIEGIPLIGIRQASLNTTQRIITRLIDILGSASVLLLGSPLWLGIALLIKLTSPGPVIFQQTRIGLNEKPFKMYKFRSMYQDAEQRKAALQARNEAQGHFFKMKDDPRITPIGKFIRKTSLDEIPQLLNVLKGDMSLVGARPPVPAEVAQYEEWQKGRFAMKGGLTGLWQVRGRSNLSFDEGVLMDLYYIENFSLRLYFQILLSTIPAVLLRRGAY